MCVWVCEEEDTGTSDIFSAITGKYVHLSVMNIKDATRMTLSHTQDRDQLWLVVMLRCEVACFWLLWRQMNWRNNIMYFA